MTTTFEELEEIVVPPGHGLMHKATREDGDLRSIWDKNNPDEVAAARRMFDELVGQKQYLAFKAEGENGDQAATASGKFDPDVERIIFRKQIQGG